MTRLILTPDGVTSLKSNAIGLDIQTRTSDPGFKLLEYGLLPPGVRVVKELYEHLPGEAYLYVMYETRPQRRDILFRANWKAELEGIEPSESDMYSLPFPWMQFHIMIPLFKGVHKEFERTINIQCSMTNEQFQHWGQNIIDFHLPNMIYPHNRVCIYGKALDLETSTNNRGMFDLEDLQSLTVSNIISAAASSVIGSGWNMNVSDWPQMLPTELDELVRNEGYDGDYDYFYGEWDSIYDPLSSIKTWESFSIKDMLNLEPSNRTIVEFTSNKEYPTGDNELNIMKPPGTKMMMSDISHKSIQ